jgi:type I restriction-modification system DNA methylase subunit
MICQETNCPEKGAGSLARDSLAWHLAKQDLAEMWAEASNQSDVMLKRELWSGLLERVYGGNVDSDLLFFQHTYLAIVAKTMAVHVVGLGTTDAWSLVAGTAFQEVGINGVVESDFFDWIFSVAAGQTFVEQVAAHASRFNMNEVEADVLKTLYESLIDPEQRHDLGEYYTPDWLAAKLCGKIIENPLEQTVLDPACGSGTFLFHAVRMYLTAA